MPVDPTITGERAALVLFSDPASSQAASPVRALQLLGLTPAESRLAAAIGGGSSPKGAAEQLEITVNTVRSTLKVVFDKLGVSRQSELARLVARLGA